MLRMPNEQRTEFHPSSNFSETYPRNTPKCNVRRNATGTYSNNRRKYNQLYKKHDTTTDQQTFNSLTAIDGHDRQYFNELRSTVVSRRIFIRSQSLIAR